MIEFVNLTFLLANVEGALPHFISCGGPLSLARTLSSVAEGKLAKLIHLLRRGDNDVAIEDDGFLALPVVNGETHRSGHRHTRGVVEGLHAVVNVVAELPGGNHQPVLDCRAHHADCGLARETAEDLDRLLRRVAVGPA